METFVALKRCRRSTRFAVTSSDSPIPHESHADRSVCDVRPHRPYSYARMAYVLILLACSINQVRASDWSEIAPRDNRGTILIHINWAEREESHSGSGTGFVIDDQGHILTVAHLIPASQTATILLSGETEPWASAYQRQMFSLRIVDVNRQADVAVLLPTQSVTLTPLPLVWDWRPVESAEVHVRGFPLGGPLEGMPGTVRRTEISPEVPISTLLREGFSGSPVYGPLGKVVGMVRGGTPVVDLKDHTVMGLGFFVPLLLLRSGLSAAIVRSADDTKISQNPTQGSHGAQVRVSYSISETKETEYRDVRDLFRAAETKPFSLRITAQPQYLIVDHQYLEHSANGLSERNVKLAPDGSWIEMTFKLTSGPGYDRTRGWLDATFVTVQRLRE